MIYKTYAELICQNCGHILWSEDEEEIEEFSELYDNHVLECPYCGSRSFKVKIKGNGGSGAEHSPPPSPSSLPHASDDSSAASSSIMGVSNEAP